ncbi:MAG: T9SS type A sorting domain-containing protein [Sphingobacteriaceae bacterium]|nr:T9SS type A sorting domain-containing protein [Sphingobacteriaceae bacterium]
MKNIFLLIFLTAISLTSTAQYRKIPLDTNHVWQESYFAWLQPQPSVTCTYDIRIIKDSIVNSQTFKFVKSVNGFCSPNGNAYYETALLRQDTVRKIVTRIINNQEKILYNFNKNVGDTAMLPTLYGPMSTFTLQTKDSILLSDGFYHKRFTFNSYPTIIEGVGSTSGLLIFGMPFEIMRSIKCLTKINPSLSTIYSSGGIGTSCLILTNISFDTEHKKNISIFPNPTSDNLNIKTESIIPKSIEIKNVLGQTIFFTNNVLQDITTINIKDFSQGVYFITVDLADKNITGHFIKN